MLVDANVLLFAVDERSPFHDQARGWLETALNGPARVGFPWPSLLAFVRIATHPRASASPLTPEQAWGHVGDWLAADAAWIPSPTDRHAEVLGTLIGKFHLRGNLISDGHLAALAIEHGVTVVSADTDFARFTEVRWEDPLSG